MAVLSTQSYLLDLSNVDIKQTFDTIIKSKLPIELLNPIELGGEWVEVDMQYTVAAISQNIEQRKVISSALESYQPKGFFSFLIDNRVVAEANELKGVLDRKDELLVTAKKIVELNQLKSELSFIKKLKIKGNQTVWVGRKLDNIEESFNQFVDELQSEFLATHPEETLELVPPKFQINHLELHDIITISDDKQELFHEFVHQLKIDCYLYAPFLTRLDQEIQLDEVELKIVGNLLPEQTLTDLKSLYTQMEIEDNFFHFQSHIFSPVAKSPAKFLFLNLAKSKMSKFEDLMLSGGVPFQTIDWNEEIVDWQNTQGLTPFQKIAQSMGTVSSKETDPSIFVSIFFILFFSIALNDALYGLIICLFTGYFLYFTKLKESWKSMFNLFFLAGIGSIGWGALSNSWAGNLFVHSPINSFLELFQIINPLELESKSPINQILVANGGISPIVVLLAFAVVIGLVQITVAYILKVVNSFKKDDAIEGFSEISWLVFVYAGMAWIGLNTFAPSLAIFGAVITLLGLAGMFIFNHGHGLGGKILSGSIKLYELIAFFADLLSYTRLIAIGLTGAIIAEVVNLLAELVSGSSGPVIGFILGAIVLIIGHLFNMVVGLFGAYINPLRLHYVEFLPKFFQGKARSFKPLQLELKYVSLK